MDEIRSRFLRDRVLTATPAQRVVMLYDRLALDLVRARSCAQPEESGPHLGHAAQIVAELLGSLEHTAGGPADTLADNLAGLYHYLLKVLMDAQITHELGPLDAVTAIVDNLRTAWTQIADGSVGAERPLAGATSWTA